MAVKRLTKYCEDRVIRNEPHPSLELVNKAVRDLLQDLPQLRTRLYTASKDMYGDYDRLVAEADLRVNVGLAGTVLSFVLASQVDALGVVLCIPMTFLAYRGLTKLREANDLLVQAVVTELDHGHAPSIPPPNPTGCTALNSARSAAYRLSRTLFCAPLWWVFALWLLSWLSGPFTRALSSWSTL
jgi:hypothetical protein